MANWGINADTLECCVGPIMLDVRMAREHGWTEAELTEAANALQEISLRYARRAQRRHPDWYERDGKNVVFVGRKSNEQGPAVTQRRAMTEETLSWLAASGAIRLGNAGYGRCIIGGCSIGPGRDLLQGRLKMGVLCAKHVIDVRRLQQ